MCVPPQEKAVYNRTHIYVCVTASGHDSTNHCGIEYMSRFRGEFPSSTRMLLGNSFRNTTGVLFYTPAGFENWFYPETVPHINFDL